MRRLASSLGNTNEQQGGKNYRVPVRVYLAGDDNLSLFTERTLNVQIEESIDPPVITVVDRVAAKVGEAAQLRATVRDPNVPEIDDYFRLANGSRFGMTVDPKTGEIFWTPSEDQAGKELDVELQVCWDGDGKTRVLSEQTIKLVVDELELIEEPDETADIAVVSPDDAEPLTGDGLGLGSSVLGGSISGSGILGGNGIGGGGGAGGTCQSPDSTLPPTGQSSAPVFGGQFPTNIGSNVGSNAGGGGGRPSGGNQGGGNQGGGKGGNNGSDKIRQVIDLVQQLKQKKKNQQSSSHGNNPSGNNAASNKPKPQTRPFLSPGFGSSQGIRLDNLQPNSKKKSPPKLTRELPGSTTRNIPQNKTQKNLPLNTKVLQTKQSLSTKNKQPSTRQNFNTLQRATLSPKKSSNTRNLQRSNQSSRNKYNLQQSNSRGNNQNKNKSQNNNRNNQNKKSNWDQLKQLSNKFRNR